MLVIELSEPSHIRARKQNARDKWLLKSPKVPPAPTLEIKEPFLDIKQTIREYTFIKSLQDRNFINVIRNLKCTELL